MTSMLTVTHGHLTRDQLAHALRLAADMARVDYGDQEPIVRRLEAGANRIRQEG